MVTRLHFWHNSRLCLNDATLRIEIEQDQFRLVTFSRLTTTNTLLSLYVFNLSLFSLFRQNAFQSAVVVVRNKVRQSYI